MGLRLQSVDLLGAAIDLVATIRYVISLSQFNCSYIYRKSDCLSLYISENALAIIIIASRTSKLLLFED